MRLRIPLLLISAALLASLSGGCYSVSANVQKGVDISPAQLDKLRGLDPAGQRAALDAMQTRAGIYSFDLFEKVARTYKLTKNPDGTMSFEVQAGHSGDVESLRAAGEVGANITTAATTAAVGAALGRPPFVIPIAKPPENSPFSQP